MAAMSLGSCSNDDEPGTQPMGTTLARISMSMTGLPQTKQAADDVNINTPNDIENIVLVPMIGDAWQNAIDLGGLTASINTTQTYTNVPIPNGTNKFRVYGGETANVSAPITETTTFALKAEADQVDNVTVYSPAGLYYYVETVTAETTGTQNVTIENNADPAQRQAAVDESTGHIAITGVRYGVGLLTTKVSASTSIKYVDATGQSDGTPTDFTGSLTLHSLFVGSQPEAVNAQFEPVAAADGGTTPTRIVHDSKMNSETIEPNDNASAVGTVNCYTTLFQTEPGEQASVVLGLTSDEDIYAKNASGVYENVTAGDVFYVKAVLSPAEATSGGTSDDCLFRKYYETKANLTINSLANATTELPDITPTDVQLDVTVDVSWEAGFTFNETID